MKINGETHDLWRAVGHEGEVLEYFVSRRCDRKAALVFLKELMKRYGKGQVIITDRLRSYCAAMAYSITSTMNRVANGCKDRRQSAWPLRRFG